MTKLASMLGVIALLSSGQLASAVKYPYLPWDAPYPDHPEPWRININRSFIEQTRLRVSQSRLIYDADQPDFVDGPTVLNATRVRDYWTDVYDWDKIENEFNEFNHFTTTVTTGPKSNYTDPVPLHFVHHRSPRPDAIPLAFFHGWPGSWIEATKIIPLLTNPPNASDPAFHIVAPSIPGFGFSPPPLKPGFGPRETANAFHTLMTEKLNYTKYVVQGGDFGGVILKWIAAQYPENVVSVHCNFWGVNPTPEEWTRYQAGQASAEEQIAFERQIAYTQFRSGYRFLHQTKPLAHAHAMMDSPLGNALYMFDLMQTAIDFHVWTAEEIITWSLMYYFQGPQAGFRYYKENIGDGTLRNPADQSALQNFANGVAPSWGFGDPFVIQPVAISEFPKDAWSAPLTWARRGGNVVQRTLNPRGGHFAAYEAPDLLVNDVRKFFGDAELSNTGQFQTKCP